MILIAALGGLGTFLATEDARVAVPGAMPAPIHVGAATCARCHPSETTAWRGSDHDLAMQEANPRTVLGDFDDASFEHFGVTSRFFRRDGKFMVHTDDRDGRLAEFEIVYAFGHYPLQQYLIAFPDGRHQALSIAWDSRPKDSGGQRWFHLYPDEPIRHDDVLHWTGPNQNWNFMCAECHSTDLRKNYDEARDRFRTTWSEINVSCEACHGPASRHVAWAERRSQWWRWSRDDDPLKGLQVAFDERRSASWTIDSATGTARRSELQPERKEIEACGRCHARRSQLSEGWAAGRSLSDTHMVSFLERGLYHADGQMLDEVYNYASFRQSKMFQRGVTCSDCHDPHSQKLRAKGDDVCLQCHGADRFAAPTHHFHAGVAPAPSCASCHMPVRTYMVVDPRHDHSFRVPRPDLSARLGTPNACNDCHADKSADWAAAAVERWHGPDRKGGPTYAEAFHAARDGAPGAGAFLRRIADDRAAPGIARATALAEMAPFLSGEFLPSLQRGLADPDPLVRIGALRSLEGAPVDRRWPLANALLGDPVRAVRIQAASLLAATPPDRIPAPDRVRLERAAQDYVEAQRLNADRPEARTNLASFLAQRGRPAEAEAEYRAAIRLEPRFIQAHVNLADLYRGLGRDREGEAVLRAALTIAPADATVHHALGLLLIRTRRMPEGIALLAQAATLDPARARYAYVHAVALSSSGRRDEAIALLEENRRRHPGDRDTLSALVSLHREAGDRDAALRAAEALRRLAPSDPAIGRLIEELRR